MRGQSWDLMSKNTASEVISLIITNFSKFIFILLFLKNIHLFNIEACILATI